MTYKNVPSFFLSFAAAALLLAAFTGCNSKTAPTSANFQAGLDKYFAESQRDCLLPNQNRFPYETSDQHERKQLEVMVKAQLLSVKYEDPVARYETTGYGNKFAPHFCFGYRQTVSIDSNTPLVKGPDGFNQSTVSYHYTMRDVPTWAKSDDMKKAFPALAAATGGNATAQATMEQTAVGWQVPE